MADLIKLTDQQVSVRGKLQTTDDILMSEATAALTHDAASGVGLAITSSNGYVDVESVRFTGLQMGLDGAADLITLSNANVKITGTLDTTGYIKVASTKFTVDATGNTYADGTLGVKGVSTLEDDLLLSEDAAVIKHSVGAGSTTAGLSILSEHYHVDVESVRFTDAKIGTTTDADLITLADGSVSITGTLDTTGYIKVASTKFTVDATGNTYADGTLGVKGVSTLEDDLLLSEDAAVIKHSVGAGSTTAGLSILSEHYHVDVESVRFTDAKIGTTTDADLITLADDSVSITGTLDTTGYIKVASTKFTVDATGNTYADGTLGVKGVSTLEDDLLLSEANAVIEHTSTDAAASLTIKSSSGYVDVESVRFTTDEIGIATDADLIKLTDQQVSVRGKLQTTDDILMSEATAALTHDAASGVGLAITSSNGYVDVESVRFTGLQMGLDGAADLITLSNANVKITGTLDTTGYIKVASTKFTVDATGNTYADGTLGVKGVSTLEDDLLLSEDAAVIKHSVGAGSTTAGLSILSEHYHVDVESVRFTDAKIGTTTDADLITLADGSVSITGTLDTTGYIKVASTKFTVDATGNTYADGTLGVKGVSTLEDDLLLSEDAAVIKHSVGAGSTTAGLSILSEHYHVDVESVRFTDAKIGTTTDADLITLADDSVSITGTLDTTGYIKVASTKFTVDATGNTYADGTLGVKGVSTLEDDLLLSEANAVIEHTSTDAAASLTIKSSSGYVDVESVRFTTDEIGIATDADLIKLTDQQVSVRGKLQTTDDILMSEATAALTHDAASGVGLAITSSNGYVDVESVRFTGLQMGLDGAADLITLSNANVKITGTLDTTGYIKVASTKFTVDATGNTYADGTLGVKGVSTLEDDLLLSEDAAVIKHSVGAGSTTAVDSELDCRF